MQLKDLLTSEFDDNLDDSDINDDEDDEEIAEKTTSMGGVHNGEKGSTGNYVQATDQVWGNQDNYNPQVNSATGLGDGRDFNGNMYGEMLNTPQGGNFLRSEQANGPSPSYNSNNHYQNYTGPDGVYGADNDDEGNDTVVNNDDMLFSDDGTFPQQQQHDSMGDGNYNDNMLQEQHLQQNNNHKLNNNVVANNMHNNNNVFNKDDNECNTNNNVYYNSNNIKNHQYNNINNPYNNYNTNNLISEQECIARMEQLRKEKDGLLNELRRQMQEMKSSMLTEVRINKHKCNVLEGR